MCAKVARVSAEGSSESEMKHLLEAGRILREGGTVVFPTETVYGLGANALSPDAARKIYLAKGRPSDNPLIVHISRVDMLYDIAEDIGSDALMLMDAFWPGPLTMIFRKKDIVPLATTGGLDTVAVRMPGHKAALKLIEAAGVPVAAPSANISGRPSITSSRYVLDEFADSVDMIIIGENSEIGIESTVVDMTEEVPVVLRPGKISQNDIFDVISQGDSAKREFLDKKLYEITGNHCERPARSPGMKYRHYSPKARVIVEEPGRSALEIMKEYLELLSEDGKHVYEDGDIMVFCIEENAPLYGDHAYILGEDSSEIARNLFTSLRMMDDMGVKLIISEFFSGDELACAVMNRLVKASSNI